MIRPRRSAFSVRGKPGLTSASLVVGILMATWTAAPGRGQDCRPCAGVVVEDPAEAAALVERSAGPDSDGVLFIAWRRPLDGTADADDFARVRAAGAVPWMAVTLRAAQPIRENLDDLTLELEDLARLASAAGEGSWIQIDWQPGRGRSNAIDYAFVFKRASVAVTGDTAQTRVVLGPLPDDAAFVEELYADDIAAYVDGVALESADGDGSLVQRLAILDPGKPIVVDALEFPESADLVLPAAARAAAGGYAVAFFDRARPSAADLAPLRVLADEFRGDLSYDALTGVEGADAWIFVRGEDTALRVIAQPASGDEEPVLLIDDRQLRDPMAIAPTTGRRTPIDGARRTTRGLQVPLAEGDVSVLAVERVTIEELGGEEERLEIAGARQMPVEEILRRLQAFEDDQRRRLRNYQARNVLYLRFQVGPAGLTASYEGPFFFDQETGFDWVWETFRVDGVKWRSKRMPELPLISPEKATVLPLEINLSREYTYRLRGEAVVDGRSCWVIDFRPTKAARGRNLHQGTVWVDREIYARVRTRAIQLGLEGDVISNEETVSFRPVDETGASGPWSSSSYVLPTRVVGQQLLSFLNETLPLETETELTEIRINAVDFEANRQAAWESDLTMVRDTEKGIRYLRSDEDGERFVEEKVDRDRFFLVGGVFWDESADFPVPLVGANYLSLDLMETGNQLNVFFAGPLLTVNFAEPRLFGSRWDAGANVFGFFLDTEDELYRDGVVVPGETIESQGSSASIFLGRPIGQFWKLDFTLGLENATYGLAEDTTDDFVVPTDTRTTSYGGDLRYTRGGYRVRGGASRHERGDWGFWGLAGSPEFDPAQAEYTRYHGSFAKTWWLREFRTFGFEAEYLGGENLDRFSRYDFGIFGDSTVAGYQGGLVRADEVVGVHLDYGLNFGEIFRFEIEGDSVWASTDDTGLDRELLAGVGLEGSMTLPWQLLTNFEIGVALAGPGRGDVALRIVFLKLFPKKHKKRP